MTITERVIREQFPFWRTAPMPGLVAEAGATYAVVGCGTSVHIADAIATTLCHNGFAARAVPGNEWGTRPGDYLPAGLQRHVVALSRSGESSETVAAAQASRARGWPVLALTCAPGSTLTRHADQVVAADTHPAEDIVMTASASLMLLMGLRFAGVAVDDAAQPAATAMEALDTRLGDALAGRAHFVFLGGGALYGIAREGALKLQEMSLSFTEAHHPMEYRHGPVSLIDARSFVTVLYHPDTAGQEAVLAAELQAKGAYVLGFGGPGDLSIALPPDAATRGLVCLPALQLLGERVALSRGLDSTRPRHLTKVVLTP